MEEKISFAEFIKNEILNFNWEPAQLDILFYSFIKANGIQKGNSFVLGTSLKEHESKILDMFKTFYNVVPKVKKLETKTNFIINDANFKNTFDEKWNKFKPRNADERKAYIAGAFAGKGWVSKPSSRFYHMEFRLGSKIDADMLAKAIDGMEIPCKTIEKGKWFVVYIKKAIALSDLLIVMHASEARMYFEDERISRAFNASIAKMDSIEPYNLKKIMALSEKQIKAIKKLKENKLWGTLKKDMIAVGEIRLEYPHYSLGDIQFTFSNQTGKSISKSTVDNWLKKIVDLAE